MNSQSFITKQYMKYYWKSLRTKTGFYEPKQEGDLEDPFWDYEPTPREISYSPLVESKLN